MTEDSPDVLVPDSPGDPALLVPIPDATLHRLSGETMGTRWVVQVALRHPSVLGAIQATIEAALAQVIAQMSQWKADSQLTRFNRLGAGEAMTIAPGFAHVLDCALTIAATSDGAFDPALGTVTEAWGFGVADAPSHRPGPVARACDWRAIALDRAARRGTQPGGLALDLSGIAKGFAVDLISLRLAHTGYGHHLVEIGGELRASGVKPDGQPWWVDVERAPGSKGSVQRVSLTGWSIATSGDWLRRRGEAGGGWSHTLSPDAGAPIVSGPRAASVLHRGCMQADALATVMMVMGETAGIDFADRHGVAAHVTDADGRAHSSAAWRAML